MVIGLTPRTRRSLRLAAFLNIFFQPPSSSRREDFLQYKTAEEQRGAEDFIREKGGGRREPLTWNHLAPRFVLAPMAATYAKWERWFKMVHRCFLAFAAARLWQTARQGTKAQRMGMKGTVGLLNRRTFELVKLVKPVKPQKPPPASGRKLFQFDRSIVQPFDG
jgi:hypothetical protein